jgi:hypothetical protein
MTIDASIDFVAILHDLSKISTFWWVGKNQRLCTMKASRPAAANDHRINWGGHS